ncbi:hypothetical protein BOTNAR_0837g00020 [Botryotinia narcissicola]|uniref:NWD NACHT-NTPase N-terminal domain-containing protein n=1 Tax=Botryotinia narcissicola TaxID=278944 RepID=A0A4Z1H6E5_9HELO|nr:hypothetical protein BOTNAR_0837g00020 [Botryotinia narcissicola]
MDSKRVFFKGLRSKPREEQANDWIGNGESAPKVETPKGAIADLISAASGSTVQHLYHLAPQTTNPTLTNQIPASKSGKTFWSRAYASLSESSPGLLKTYEKLLLNTNINNPDTQELSKQEQMAATVQNRVEMMESKQWTIELSGKSLKVKDQVKGIMEAFQKVKGLGTALASIDPIIFGLPWAGVSLLLTLVLSDSKQNETLLDGLETIADIIARYAVIESDHLNTAITGDLGIQLESRVVKIYACILKYQAKAACYLSKSTPKKFMRNLPKLDDWSKLLTEVTSEDEKFYKWISLQNSRRIREIHDRMFIQPSTITPPYFEVPTGRKIPHFIGRREILKRIKSAHLRSSSSKAKMVVLRGIGGQAKVKGPGNDCGSGDTKLDFVKDTIRTHKEVDTLVENTAAAIELLGLPDKEALQLLYQQSGTEENEFNEKNGLSIVKRLGYHALAITQAGAYIKNLELDFSAFESHYSRRRADILKYSIPMNKYTKLLSEFEEETALNVFTTWELSFDELKSQPKRTDLEELLTILAFFDPLDISEELFSRYLIHQLPWSYKYPGFAFCQREAGVWNRDAFADALQILERLSLIQSFHASTNSEYHESLHPLVKDRIRLRAKEALCEEYTVLAAEMIAALAEIYSPEVTKFPEVVFVFLYAHQENIGYITTPNVVEGSYDESPNKQYFRRLKESGELGKASKLQRKVFEYNKENRRDDAPIFLKSLFEVTKTLIELGITEEAEQLYRAAIDLAVKLLGEAHVTTLKIKIELAKLLEKTTQTEEADKLFTEIFSFASTWAVLEGDKEGEAKILGFMDDLGSRLQILIEQYRSEDLFQLRSATVLAALNLQQFNKFDEAEQFFKRNWLLCTENLKGNDLLSLDAQLRYARMLRYLAKKEKAEELAKGALQRLKESCGEESIEFRRWNENWGSKWIEQTNKVLKDLDVYYEQVLGSADDVTDEEKYAAWRAWKVKVGEEVVDRLEESYETSEGSDHRPESEEEDEDEDAKERYAARFGTLGSNMQVMDIYSTCQVIDTKKVPGFFSRYPAAISVGATDVESALSAVAREASQPDSRERRRALIRHSNAYGDPFSICHCSAEVERLVLLASIIEVMWIHDDVTEELDHGAVSWDCRLGNEVVH